MYLQKSKIIILTIARLQMMEDVLVSNEMEVLEIPTKSQDNVCRQNKKLMAV
jgi:hypothetical protein